VKRGRAMSEDKHRHFGEEDVEAEIGSQQAAEALKNNTQEQDIALEKDFEKFMAGYSREPIVMAKLASALVRAMNRHPQLRLGQLLVAALSKRTGANDITNALFNIHDEELIELLSDF
jgi:hypothetical protein